MIGEVELERWSAIVHPSSRAYGNMKAYQAHAAVAANHTPIANDPGHSSAPPKAHAHCPTCPLTRMSLATVAPGDPSQQITVLVQAVVKDLINTMSHGDLIKQFEADARGEILDLKNTINGMVVRLRALAAEVTRVTLELGSQSKLGGQAHVLDVEGVSVEGEIFVGTVNSMVDQLSAFSSEVTSVALGVGMQGTSAKFDRSSAIHLRRSYDSRRLGDLGELVNVDVRGEMLDLKMTVNSMVAQLSTLANEVTRVSLEVGTKGILGGQAFVPDVRSIITGSLSAPLSAPGSRKDDPVIVIISNNLPSNQLLCRYLKYNDKGYDDKHFEVMHGYLYRL
ncbi:hypothetical protein BYT27DRAFT_7250385 [Phlegmacium glaucopus]|nr:hypothetical protein BYT27DRAFT_7250385 [Phlegmacium glaucopus]